MSGKKKLLLHCCCAPCTCGVLDRLDDYEPTLCFINPNIDTAEEYYKRAAELERLSALTLHAPVIIPPYDPAPFYAAVKGLEDEPEGGRRCDACIRLRLAQAAKYAKAFDAVTTTLTVSPHKNAPRINAIGAEITDKWVYADFKKKDGFKHSVTRSREMGLYRQRYCGCVFSKRDE